MKNFLRLFMLGIIASMMFFAGYINKQSSIELTAFAWYGGIITSWLIFTSDSHEIHKTDESQVCSFCGNDHNQDKCPYDIEVI